MSSIGFSLKNFLFALSSDDSDSTSESEFVDSRSAKLKKKLRGRKKSTLQTAESKKVRNICDSTSYSECFWLVGNKL